jgi:hypothetical protein
MMETNPYEYSTTVPWIPRQNQLYESAYVTTGSGSQRPPVSQNQGLAQRGVSQKSKLPERMPKARTLALVRTFKKWLVIASVVSFGTFSGLAAFHQVSTTTTSQATNTSSGTSQKTSATTSSSQSSNSFLNQQGSNNFGSSNSSQTTVSGSSVS